MTLRTHNDGTLFAEHLDGPGPTVLALHGWGRNRSDLTGALDGHRAVVPDLPGFGASPPPPEAWGAAGYATAVADAAREVGEGPYVVVGHSFGGRVAAHLAADHAEMVAGVVFAGTPLLRSPSAGRPRLAYRVVRAAHRRRLVPDATMERYRQRYGSADYRAAEGVMRDVLVRTVAEDYADQLARTTQPVGFCWGELDTAAPVDMARRAADGVGRVVAFEVAPGVGHDVHLDAPELLRQVLRQVVDAAASTPA